MSQVKPVLDRLNEDVDTDVRFFASEASLGKWSSYTLAHSSHYYFFLSLYIWLWYIALGGLSAT